MTLSKEKGWGARNRRIGTMFVLFYNSKTHRETSAIPGVQGGLQLEILDRNSQPFIGQINI